MSEAQSNAVSSCTTPKKLYRLGIQADIEHVCQSEIQNFINAILGVVIDDFLLQ